VHLDFHVDGNGGAGAIRGRGALGERVGHRAAEHAEEEGARGNRPSEMVKGTAGFGLGMEAAWWDGQFANVRMVVL